jgi:hypothetical protein
MELIFAVSLVEDGRRTVSIWGGQRGVRRQIDNEGGIVLGKNSCNIQNAEGAIQLNETLNILARGKSTVCMRGDGGPMYATQASFQYSWPLSEVIFIGASEIWVIRWPEASGANSNV